jgi:transcription initiation factor TFIIIB Brf1 subunit/transcription initiation factor TFIIB
MKIVCDYCGGEQIFRYSDKEVRCARCGFVGEPKVVD